MNELISVILPVYNVSMYMDKCLNSLINQTYKNLEIILVDDGSTDDSGEKCEEWAKKDNRVVVIRTENRGVGNARNTGIELATGKYLVFVDPDDWVDELFIEKLRKEMKQHDADIVSCNLMHYQEKKDLYKKSGPVKRFYIVENDEKKEYMYTITYSTGSKLYKTELFANKYNRFPNYFYEDAALFPQLVHQAGRIVHIDEGLYFYLIDRSDSTTNTISKAEDLFKAIRYAAAYFQNRNILGEWEEALRKFFAQRLCYRYELYNGGEIPSEVYNPVYDEFGFNKWHELLTTRAYVWGSFNTRWAVYAMNASFQSVGRHICFSSFISQMLGNKLEYEIIEKNPFRRAKLEFDFMQNESDAMQKLSESGMNMIILDFLDQRYDVLEVEGGCYVTDSEALRENGIKLNIVSRIEAGSEKHWKLWTEACDKLIAKIDSLDRNIPVILLKMRLAKGYYTDGEYVLFEEQDIITRLNTMIEKMEKYFTENCKRVLFFQVEDDFNANAQCRYGCAPQYLERTIYRQYEAKIVEYIKNR